MLVHGRELSALFQAVQTGNKSMHSRIMQIKHKYARDKLRAGPAIEWDDITKLSRENIEVPRIIGKSSHLPKLVKLSARSSALRIDFGSRLQILLALSSCSTMRQKRRKNTTSE
jgi:type IV secretory pathway ATPase VirB11/archaellum biosynthesis ATPase